MSLFDQACELPRSEVAAFLKKLDGADTELRAQLEAMLAVDRKSHIFFDQTHGGAAVLANDLLDSAWGRGAAVTPARPEPHDQAPMPQFVGEYEIVERLGAGGMGSVYRAHQKSPDRIVALKMLHPWLVSASALERFRFEAQALATVQHPCIPPVFTVGQHDGAVYFAMKLVEGPTLSKWAATRQPRPSVTDTLTLLTRVCDAVHHAHLRGFVHRDLKPDNIRVTEGDTPQVLDFGISAGRGERTVDVAGTPAYMSPEQLEPNAPVDVRTDVFSLGVIAFELLTGQLPASPNGTGLATLQALKRTPAPKLRAVGRGQVLDAQLESIIARALEVDPARRYGSVAELGDDLKRYLTHEPVLAHGAGALYRAERFVRRNRLAVFAAAALALALGGGATISLLQYFKAERAYEKAETDASRAKASLEFLTTVLQDADSDNAGGRQATIGQALDRATQRLGNAHLDPYVEATVRGSLANTYVGLGEWKAAETQATLALAAYDDHHLPDDEALAEVLRVVAEVREEMGEVQGAVEAGVRGLAIEERFHGATPHDHTSYALHVVAIAAREAGDFQNSLAWHERAVAIERALHAAKGPDALPDTLDQYGVTLSTIGRYDEAEAAHREALGITVEKLGPTHLNVAIGYHHLGQLAFERGRYAEARELLAKALDIRLPTLGKDHVRVGMQYNIEALIALAEGRIEDAQAAATECMRIARLSFGSEFGRYARLEGTQVLIWAAQGRGQEAVELSEKILEFAQQRYPARHFVTVEARSNHALALLVAGRAAEAERELKDVVATSLATVGPATRLAREAQQRLEKAQRALR